MSGGSIYGCLILDRLDTLAYSMIANIEKNPALSKPARSLPSFAPSLPILWPVIFEPTGIKRPTGRTYYQCRAPPSIHPGVPWCPTRFASPCHISRAQQRNRCSLGSIRDFGSPWVACRYFGLWWLHGLWVWGSQKC